MLAVLDVADVLSPPPPGVGLTPVLFGPEDYVLLLLVCC